MNRAAKEATETQESIADVQKHESTHLVRYLDSKLSGSCRLYMPGMWRKPSLCPLLDCTELTHITRENIIQLQRE